MAGDLKIHKDAPREEIESKEKLVAEDKIRTYGIELVLIGIITFIAIIAFTILSYKLFVKDRVKKSTEYNTATYYVVNSETLKEQLLSPMESMEFGDLQVTENETFGVCELSFTLRLQNGLTENLSVALVKVADFWLVYEVILSPDTPAAYRLVSTYQKVNTLLNYLSYQDTKLADIILQLIKNETRDPNLVEYLSARVHAMAGNQTYAAQLLDDLRYRVSYSKLAVMYERAMIHFSENEYEKARDLFQQIITEYELAEANEDSVSRARSIFSGLPKDPLIASFSHDTVLADTYQNLSLIHYHLGEFGEGLKHADLALEKALAIGSKSIHSTALYVKALNLYQLKDYEKADENFEDVIADLDNHNLSQKAWSYYYRGQIAIHLGSEEECLDYFERAVNLDPFNYVIRLDTVRYLMNRNSTGDLEIALSFALRGVQNAVEEGLFKDLAQQLYARLGIRR